jgi:hypothetical protein
VRPRKRTNGSERPTEKIHLGGLMARSPLGSTENYVFIVVGMDTNDYSVETKTTVDGLSNYTGPAWGEDDAELRICRLSSVFYMYRRAPGASGWTMAGDRPFGRVDLPATLEVGPVVYAATLKPDLDVAFDQVRFEPVANLTDCTRD